MEVDTLVGKFLKGWDTFDVEIICNHLVEFIVIDISKNPKFTRDGLNWPISETETLELKINKLNKITKAQIKEK